MHDIIKIMSDKKNGCTFLVLGLALLIVFIGCASMSTKEEAPKEEAAVSSVQQKQITGIIISGSDSAGKADQILLTANNQLEYTSTKQSDPLGINFYFPETDFGQIQSQYTPDSGIIASIKTAMAPDQKGAKIEVVLKKDASYDVKRSGNDIEISFAPKPIKTLAETPVAVVTLPEKMTAKAMDTPSEEKPVKEPEKQAKPQTEKKEISSKEPAVINQIDFSSQESGKSSVIIGTSGPVDYAISKVSDRAMKVRLFNSRLPEFRRQRPLITTRFNSAIDRITPIQAVNLKNEADIIIELRESVPYRPVHEDKTLTINFDPSSIKPRPVEAAKLPEWQQVIASTAAPEETAAAPAAVPLAATTESPAMPIAESKSVVKSVLEPEEEKPAVAQEKLPSELQQQKEYTGQKIALDFYETDIKNVFRILQQVSGKNYAVDKDVTGEVTISLEKPVPWDQVLDLILQMNQLGKVEEGDIVRIAKAETLKTEEEETNKKLAAIHARKEQEKQLEPLETAYIACNYARAKDEVKPHIDKLITKDRGNLTVDERNNQFVITDTHVVIEKCRQIISEIDKVTPQVQIEARIVEVSETFERDLGIQWDASGDNIYRSDLGGQYTYNIATNTPYPGDLTKSANLGLKFERLNAWGTPIVLDAALRAMETQGQGKIISSPKIVTLNNKEALIKQGQRIPYIDQTAQGATTTKFVDAVLSLGVTPQITPDKRIALQIKTTKDEVVGYSPANQPITSVNEANTDLLVDDGETIVIGGVAKTDSTITENGFPILKDIPLLGWLFKSTQTKTSRNELLIFMTPKVIQLEQKNIVQK